MASYVAGVRLPVDVERGAAGGPRFNTTVLSLDSGYEKRNINWSQARGEWEVGYGLMQKFQDDPDGAETDLDHLIKVFRVMHGRAYSFRFKDWSDYEIGQRNGALDIDGQVIGLGDGVTTEFQVFKRYQVESNTHDRTITKLVDGTVKVYKDAVLLGTGYTVDHDTGLITFTSAPLATGGTGEGGAESLAVRCEFDCHVRFDSDDLKLSMELFNAGSWENIPLVELLGTGL